MEYDPILDELLSELHWLRLYKGYSCLVSCVKLAVEDENRLSDTLNEIYYPVAQQYGMKLKTMEKNLGTVRNAFLAKGGKQILERRIGGVIEEDLYPRELIEALAECVWKEKKKEKEKCQEKTLDR